MKRTVSDRESDKAAVARIEKEMAAPRIAKSVRDAMANRAAASGPGRNHGKKKSRRRRPNERYDTKPANRDRIPGSHFKLV